MTTGERAYLAIDIGATKTLCAAFSADGRLLLTHQFPTAKNYPKFLKDLGKVVREEFEHYQFTEVCCAVPGRIDRKAGIGEVFGNLTWRNVPIKEHLKRLIHTAVWIENDANLAGLSEAILVQKKYKRVLYLTLSTGIGDGFIINGKIDPTLADSEAGQMMIEHRGRIAAWEDFASGRALKSRYGQLAKDIEDPLIWDTYAKDVAAGLNELLAVLQPEVVIIGGSVGNQLEKFADGLKRELADHPNKMVDIPPIIKAQRPKDAVIYGCYELIKQNV